MTQAHLTDMDITPQSPLLLPHPPDYKHSTHKTTVYGRCKNSSKTSVHIPSLHCTNKQKADILAESILTNFTENEKNNDFDDDDEIVNNTVNAFLSHPPPPTAETAYPSEIISYIKSSNLKKAPVTSPICILCDTGQDMTAAHLDECSALNDLNCIVKSSPPGGATEYTTNRQVANVVAKNDAYLALSSTFRYVFIESPL
ncbi:hypothetical protein TNCV_3320771 [Trichonephila clavipes]|nr:hypothetical protein TNCV_3320771 [Trichonephila clavipes]